MHLSINICKKLSSAVFRPLRRTFQVHLAWQVIIQIWPTTAYSALSWDLLGLSRKLDWITGFIRTCPLQNILVWFISEKFFSICFAPSCWKTINHPIGVVVGVLEFLLGAKFGMDQSGKYDAKLIKSIRMESAVGEGKFLSSALEELSWVHRNSWETKVFTYLASVLLREQERAVFFSSCYLNYSIELFPSGEKYISWLGNHFGQLEYLCGKFQWDKLLNYFIGRPCRSKSYYLL